MLSAPGHGRTDSATHGGMSDLDALNKNILLVRGSCVSALQRLRCIYRQGDSSVAHVCVMAPCRRLCVDL